jgi:hypothetical protein
MSTTYTVANAKPIHFVQVKLYTYLGLLRVLLQNSGWHDSKLVVIINGGSTSLASTGIKRSV